MLFISVLTILFQTLLSEKSVFSDRNTMSGSLIVKTTNIRELKGNLMVAIYKGEKGFRDPKYVHNYKIIPVKHSNTEVIFENVSAGEYAIAVYQDLNKNNILDIGWFGIPTEPYGFSNNPMILVGPPTFKDAKFHYNESEKSISVVLN